MAPKTTKRRSPHEGGAYNYSTKAGLRWYWKAVITGPDGTARPKVKRGFETKQAALAGLREALSASARGGYAEPSKQLLGSYLATWLDGLRLADSTVASYRKNVRLHIAPHIGTAPLASLTATRLDALYRELERSGRADHKAGQGLSARTVRYIHTIISSALRDAVDAGLLPVNPASRAHPPTAKQARAPEMHPWDARQLAAFLGWAREHSELHAAWHVLAHTGMRRGELLALRWRDVDLDAGTLTVRRSVGVVKTRGQHEQITEGPTKTARPRVIDVDPGTLAVLKSWKTARGTLALVLARPGALVFGNIQGTFRHPETFSKTFTKAVARCRRDLGEDAVPAIRLHDLRHTHATILQGRGVASDATFRARREDGAVREWRSGYSWVAIATTEQTRRPGRCDRTMLRQMPGCCAHSGCIRHKHEAAKATKKRSDEGRCHHRPVVTLTYSAWLVKRSLPVCPATSRSARSASGSVTPPQPSR